MMTRQETTESVRPPAVASLFYPGEAAELKQNLREMLDEASEAEDPNEDLPAGQHLRALIVPHAGYVYSGTTAALAYHLLRKNRDDFHRILLLGPAHENDGRLNLFGALRTSMATCGYVDIKEFQKAEVMVAPALQTEGKSLQKAQGVGMGH